MRDKPPLPKQPSRNRAMEATIRLWHDHYCTDPVILERVATKLRTTLGVAGPAADTDVTP